MSQSQNQIGLIVNSNNWPQDSETVVYTHGYFGLFEVENYVEFVRSK